VIFGGALICSFSGASNFRYLEQGCENRD